MYNKLVYRQHNKIWLEYEYWFLGFKRKGKKCLATLRFPGDRDSFSIYPDGFAEQLRQLESYYRGLYYNG